jgi:hypothetical protein
MMITGMIGQISTNRFQNLYQSLLFSLTSILPAMFDSAQIPVGRMALSKKPESWDISLSA